MSTALIGLFSALLVAILSIVGQIIIHKLQRHDNLTDAEQEQNRQVIEHFSSIENKLEKMDEKIDYTHMKIKELGIIECRIRILRFADEILHGVKHSKDHFDQTMQDITLYEHYCEKHPDFKNNITVTSISIIQENYKESYEKNDFL